MSRRVKRDIAAKLRALERPIDRTTSIGVASSIGGDGHSLNGQNYNDGEVRDLDIALPYGISSSGVDGIRVQIINNGNQNNTAVGVIDGKRPPVKSGCVIIYDKSGQRIILDGDGTIKLVGNVYINGVSFDDILNRLNKLEENL